MAFPGVHSCIYKMVSLNMNSRNNWFVRATASGQADSGFLISSFGMLTTSPAPLPSATENAFADINYISKYLKRFSSAFLIFLYGPSIPAIEHKRHIVISCKESEKLPSFLCLYVCVCGCVCVYVCRDMFPYVKFNYSFNPV